MKLKLEIFSKNEEKQYIYLKHLMLTFRAKLPLISELFQIDEEELYEKLIKYNDNSYRAFIYLFHHDLNDQDVAREEVVTYYNNLLNAILNKDSDEQHRLVDKISDSKAVNVQRKSLNGIELSDEDMLVVVNHQLKYAMSNRALANLFSLYRTPMTKRIAKIIGDDNLLRDKVTRIINFSEDMWDGRKK